MCVDHFIVATEVVVVTERERLLFYFASLAKILMVFISFPSFPAGVGSSNRYPVHYLCILLRAAPETTRSNRHRNINISVRRDRILQCGRAEIKWKVDMELYMHLSTSIIPYLTSHCKTAIRAVDTTLAFCLSLFPLSSLTYNWMHLLTACCMQL